MPGSCLDIFILNFAWKQVKKKIIINQGSYIDKVPGMRHQIDTEPAEFKKYILQFCSL